MGGDAGSRRTDGQQTEFRLPRIVELRARVVPFEPRRPRNFESALAGVREAVEFSITTDSAIPVRALGPTLFIGDAPVTESEPLGENHYRFFAFDIRALKPGAPISFGWSGARPEDRMSTGFRFEPEEEELLSTRS